MGLVRGFIWKARMYNDAIFKIWVPNDITRSETRNKLLTEAQYYTKNDIESLWKTLGV